MASLRHSRYASGMTVSRVAGWGRIGVPGHEKRGENLEQLTKSASLSRGLGRSYGDSSLPSNPTQELVSTVLADRILAFDRETGLMRAEAGTSLKLLNDLFLNAGFFVPVTPGTQFVTLGGMVASDVHGKEHHARGCFGKHVTRLRMRVADGRVLWCSPNEHSDLFYATQGGMGLTGHILEVEFRMLKIPSPWIYQETTKVKNLDEYLLALKDAAGRFPYTVGWIDCLTQGAAMGRGILISGRWALEHEAPKKPAKPKRVMALPFDFPDGTLSPLFVKTFNAAFYAKHFTQQTKGIAHYEDFFYPLDAIRHWNRMYGPRGFTQYQCVLPHDVQSEGARAVLTTLTQKKAASFLCVIKDCGEEGGGILSFPMRGISIALDIAYRDDIQETIDALNEVVIQYGGRIYLTKDQFTRADHFGQMEPRLQKFMDIRKRWDPSGLYKSAQSVRLFGDTP